jgi:hypothetical protein
VLPALLPFTPNSNQLTSEDDDFESASVIPPTDRLIIPQDETCDDCIYYFTIVAFVIGVVALVYWVWNQRRHAARDRQSEMATPLPEGALTEHDIEAHPGSSSKRRKGSSPPLNQHSPVHGDKYTSQRNGRQPESWFAGTLTALHTIRHSHIHHTQCTMHHTPYTTHHTTHHTPHTHHTWC